MQEQEQQQAYVPEALPIAQPSQQSEDLLEKVISNSERQFELLQRQAAIAAASRCYPDAPTTEAAAIKMMMARTLDIDPMVAMTDIRVYEGKPEISAGLTAALLQRAGYTWKFVQHDQVACRAAFWLNGQPLTDVAGNQVVHGFTMEQAKRAGYDKRGVTEKNPQNNYGKVAENMLFARMITNFCKWYAPSVTRGMTIYAFGEIEAAQSEEPGAGAMKMPERVAAPEKVVA